jgi:hypothetical protein
MFGVEAATTSNHHRIPIPGSATQNGCPKDSPHADDDVRPDAVDVRSSFWTGDEQDDDKVAPLGAAMEVISPERVNMAFDCIQSPRDFVTLLLGGGANQWSNVDFAGAFGSVVLGHPIVPHIVRLSAPPVSIRAAFPIASGKVRPGLFEAFASQSGTVSRQMGKEIQPFKQFLSLHREYKVYAKTGTLPSAKDKPRTSRLVLALVKWRDSHETDVESGMVFSLVIDRARVGMAAEWFGQFIGDYQADIERLLQN